MFVKIFRNIKKQELEHEISVIDQQIKGLEDLKKVNQDKLNNLQENVNILSEDSIVIRLINSINKSK